MQRLSSVSTRHHLSRATRKSALASVLVLTGTGLANAAQLTWSGTGDWNTTDTTWDGGTAAWVNGNHARLDSPSGTLTLTEDITVADADGAPFINAQTSGYTINATGANKLTLQAISGPGYQIGTGGSAITINAPVVLSGNNIDFRATTTFNGVISDDGGTRKILNNFSTIYLNNANTFTGGVEVGAFGQVVIGHDQGLGTGGFRWSGIGTVSAGGGDRTVANIITPNWNDTFHFAGSNDLTFSSAQSLWGAFNDATGPTYDVQDANGVLTFASLNQVVGQNAGMTKTGAGTFRVQGSYSARYSTTVNQGTLILNDTASALQAGYGFVVNSDVSNGKYATLGGNGDITSFVTANAGSTIAPGDNGTGQLGTGNLTLASGSTLAIEVNGIDVGSLYDQVDVTGTVDITDSLLSFTLGYAPTVGDAYTILNNDGTDAIIGTFAGLAQDSTFDVSYLGNTYRFQIDYAGGTGNDALITNVAIPEPASLGLVGVAGLMLRKRRR